MKKRFPTLLHESAELYDYIYISAGVRGLQLKLSPRDLVAYTEATVADLISENE
jgi:Cys-tRNA(Pro)/Cys-tRNA(Cys) deacylase